VKTPAGAFKLTIVLCLAGIGLQFVPAESARPIRGLVRDALCPGQAAVDAGIRRSRAWFTGPGNSRSACPRPDDGDDERQSLRLENRRLELQIAVLRERADALAHEQGLTPAAGSPPPLFRPKLVAARVLGEETAAAWRGRKMLSIGARGEIAESALVLDDARPLVDLGEDAGLAPGDETYAGRIVLGKIAEVGRFSSTLRLVTDPAYSGRARLARRTSRGLVFGAEGTLVGDGSDLCRLRRIADPVNVGDEVFTGGADGLLPLPMYYGRVVRAELEPGANEWSVWVQPAATAERLETVLVLRRAVNVDRVSGN
jgi:cell shape-determining protein MreC